MKLSTGSERTREGGDDKKREKGAAGRVAVDEKS